MLPRNSAVGKPRIEEHPGAAEHHDAGHREARVRRPRVQHRRRGRDGRAAADRGAEREKPREGARQAEQAADHASGRERRHQATGDHDDGGRAHQGHPGERQTQPDQCNTDLEHGLRHELHTGLQPRAHAKGIAPGDAEQHREHYRTDRNSVALPRRRERCGAELCGCRQREGERYARATGARRHEVAIATPNHIAPPLVSGSRRDRSCARPGRRAAACAAGKTSADAGLRCSRCPFL